MGRKPNPLPDHSEPVLIKHVIKGEHPLHAPCEIIEIDPNDIHELGKEYGFSDSYPLIEKLEQAYFMGELLARNPPAKGEQKKILRTLVKRIDDLSETLNAMGLYEANRLSVQFPEGYGTNFTRIKDVLIQWRKASNRALKCLRGAGKDTRKSFRHCFFRDLADIWEDGTGSNATCGWDDTKGLYVGDFYMFVTDAASLARIEISTWSDPGAMIVKALTKRREKKELAK